MKNEATLNSARTVIRFVIQPVIHPTPTTAAGNRFIQPPQPPPVTDSKPCNKIAICQREEEENTAAGYNSGISSENLSFYLSRK
jgi:hypothetical protein